MVIWGWKSGFVLVSASNLEEVILLPPRTFISFFLFFLAPPRVAWGILVHQTGIGPVSSAVKAQSPNHWTTREFPETLFLQL